MSAATGVRLLDRAARHAHRIGISDATGDHAYGELLRRSAAAASALLGGRADLAEARVAFMAASGAAYVAAQWGIWRAGGVAVPLCTTHPPRELEYVLDDTGAEAVLADAAHEVRLRPLADARNLPLLRIPAAREDPAARQGPAFREQRALPRLGPDRRAMILYTSGTTSRPKGVVSTHGNLEAQVTALVEAWEWTAEDRILHILPLHHTHGIVNALLCALWAGAACEMLPGFDPDAVWRRIAEGAAGERPPITLFMAVPTIYTKLIAAHDERPAPERRAWGEAAGGLRLMVSGSAALPVPVFERWREITGHDLLERYGMTEIGMALSNPLRGERRPGTVGVPLPRVEARRVDEEGAPVEGEAEGEIEVRGPSIFIEYWGRPEATRDAFRKGGWFRTGDIALVEDGYWRILGRRSVDIIKTGGYKVSALEVEAVLRGHPAVADCAVVGVPDAEWGERVCAAVVTADADGSPEAFDAWTRERLAGYKRPRRWLLVRELPRNAMGKVTKPAVQAMFREGERT